MIEQIWLFTLAVFFVAVNGLTTLSYAASLGFALKPTAFAYFVGVIGNLLTGSVTPISAQAATLTFSGFLKNINQRTGALIIGAVGMVLLGMFGGVTAITAFVGQPVIFGMMAGVGLMLAGVSLDMLKQNPRTGAISFVAGLFMWAWTRDLVYVVASAVTLSSLDFIFIQKKRVDIQAIALANGQNVDNIQSDDHRFWTKAFWEEFKVLKPRFDLTAIFYALGFMCIAIGTNIAFGNVTAGIAGTTQNPDHLTMISGLADIASALFGGAPIAAIISGTAAAPWPVAAGIAMMLLVGILLFLGLMTRIAKYVPAQSIAGFLFVIGFFSTFLTNVNNAFATGYNAQVAFAMGVTALTKNPFFGLLAGLAIRQFGFVFGL